MTALLSRLLALTFRRYTIAAAMMTALLACGSAAQAHLLDEFSRADAAAVGNGWIEKNAAAFAIAANRVSKGAVGQGYRDNVLYRPSNEDVLNVEASTELTFASLPIGYPQILVRVQSSTVATADRVDAYMLYVADNPTQAILGRQTGTAFVETLGVLNLSAALNTTDRFRLRLRATGTNPVQLEAYVERLGANGVWTTIGQATASDASASRIATAGSVALSGYVENNYAFDNFVRVDLGAIGTANPMPTASSLAPASASAGESELIVVVYGSGFTTDSVVRWNGANLATTYVSPSELEAVVPGANLAAPGNASVAVLNPGPGGGTSGALNFTIASAGTQPPAITSLSPSSATAGGGSLTLTVNGSGFDASSVVRWNGAARTSTYVSATQLTASIPAADLTSAGTANVTVQRVSDGTTSGSAVFTINPAQVGDFLDTFTRADSSELGNGWIEKTPSVFAIAANEAAKTDSGSDYRNNVAYRPAGEDTADVEVSAELRLLSLPTGYPQVMARVQSATVANPGQLDAYLLYVNNSTTQAMLSRQRGSAFDTPLAAITLSSALNTTDRYRLRLRVTGTNPVSLAGYVERWTGSSWQIIGQGTASDVDSGRITSAGSIGFGGYIETSSRFDNVARTNIASSNPTPAVTSLSPSTVVAGSGALTLTVNGADFVAGSVVRWNGADRPTTYLSATSLQASIAAGDVASSGSANVTVFNPTPGGGVSNVAAFTISSGGGGNPVPVVTTLSPASTSAGGSAFMLTVNGSGFVASSVVRWNGSNRTTTFVSSSQLTAQVSASDIAAQGSANVSVFTPSPGGGTSGTVTFTITAAANNPIPTTSSLSPSSMPAARPGFTLTVNGANFVAGSVVRWNGANRTTTYVSPSQITAFITSGDIASAGTANVTVFNPTPGGGTSSPRTFTIATATSSNPAPSLTAMTPVSWPAGGSAFTLTVTGENFGLQSTVHWNGAARPTTVVSQNELRADITSMDVANATLATVTVFTPTPGGGRSMPLTFFVQDGSLQFFSDSFNRADSEVVGNSWIEKNPDSFRILGGELPSNNTTGGFQQDIMYRPQTEERLNMEASMEFRRLSSGTTLDTGNWPQLHARVQSGTAGVPWTLDSYIFFIEEVAIPTRAMFAITTSPTLGTRNECYLAPLPLPAPLAVGQRYRLRFRVQGVAPVTLWGAVDRYDDGVWTMIASGTTTHDSNTVRDPSLYCDGPNPTLPPPITSPGVAGLAKWTNRTDVYDNFYLRDMTPPEPPAVIASLSPSSATAGGTGLTVVVNGSGFTPDSLVRWNGSARTTQYISPTQINATITAADLALPGLASVTVIGNLSAESAEQIFSIQPSSGTVSFQDTFNRTDNANVGNGWIEKTPAAFALQAGRAAKLLTPGGDYRNNIVYRPAAENRRDVEAEAEFRVRSLPIGYPQLMVRVQQATANTTNGFEGYMLFMDASETLGVLARQGLNGFETRLATFNLSQPLVQNGVYRMRLRAVGDASVALQAWIERLVGGTWTVIGQVSATDASGARVSTAGATGFGGYIEDAYEFDNFRRINLGSQ